MCKLISSGSVIIPKTLKGDRAQVMKNLTKFYRLSDSGKPANKTTAAFRAVWAQAHGTDWKMPFMCAAAPEYREIVCAAIVFYHGAEPIQHDHAIESTGYAAW